MASGKTLILVGDKFYAVTNSMVIAPMPKLQTELSDSDASQKKQITLDDQLIAKDLDLVYVLGKENFNTSIIGE